MNINDFILSFAKAIKADSFFENIKIIKPYPNVSFAGEIKHTIVTIGLGEVAWGYFKIRKYQNKCRYLCAER